MAATTNQASDSLNVDLESGIAAKKIGNDKFKSNEFKAAITSYTEAIDNFEDYYDAHYDDSLGLNPTSDSESTASTASSDGKEKHSGSDSAGNGGDTKTENKTESSDKTEKSDEQKKICKDIAICYSNRAFCHIKMENFGSAIADAERAIQTDSTYSKGYYRLGSAKFALQKYKDAQKAFKSLCKLEPTDRDARSKLKECDKAVQAQKFALAIACDNANEGASVEEKIRNMLDIEKPISSSSLSDSSNKRDGSHSPNKKKVTSPRGVNTTDKKLSVNITVATKECGSKCQIPIPSDYSGPIYEGQHKITHDFCVELCNYMKDEKVIAKRYAYHIVYDILQMLKSTAHGGCTLQHIPMGIKGEKHATDKLCSITNNRIETVLSDEFTVCGDVHGQYYDLLNIFKMNGYPSESNPYLFNGDFVDRGSFSTEVILCLFAWKLLYPDKVFLARGNHETMNMNKMYGFEGEVKSKFDLQLYSLFCYTFCHLPLSHVLANEIFIVHGGLFSKDHVTLSEIQNEDRICEPKDAGIMVEMLWSDPHPLDGRYPSRRGVGCQFGPDITKDFLKTNDLSMVVRSHEMKDDGYELEHDGKLITIFSAPNYCDQMKNKGGYIRYKWSEDEGVRKAHYANQSPAIKKSNEENLKKLAYTITSYAEVPHPTVKPMSFANPMLGHMMGLQ